MCEYANILGLPDEGFHTHTIGHINLGFALGDAVLTLIVSFIISKLTGFNLMMVVTVMLLTAIFLHWWFCVPTVMNKLLDL